MRFRAELCPGPRLLPAARRANTVNHTVSDGFYRAASRQRRAWKGLALWLVGGWQHIYCMGAGLSGLALGMQILERDGGGLYSSVG